MKELLLKDTGYFNPPEIEQIKKEFVINSVNQLYAIYYTNPKVIEKLAGFVNMEHEEFKDLIESLIKKYFTDEEIKIMDVNRSSEDSIVINRLDKDVTIVVYDVINRFGIGVEIYRNNELIIEMFRDDEKQKRTVTVFRKEIDLDLLEECIKIYKEVIPWDFVIFKT